MTTSALANSEMPPIALVPIEDLRCKEYSRIPRIIQTLWHFAVRVEFPSTLRVIVRIEPLEQPEALIFIGIMALGVFD